ncbi:MAG: phage tail tape measure protein [Clostridia bacterium]
MGRPLFPPQRAEAMENLASAGFLYRKLQPLCPVCWIWLPPGEDLASSADIASSTLRAFGLEAGEAGHVADVLAKNAADTNAAIMDTGYAMKYVAPVAHSAGWSLESVTAAIGKMADEGIRGETAGTTLRSALVRMMNPTDEMAEAMEALGITL